MSYSRPRSGPPRMVFSLRPAPPTTGSAMASECAARHGRARVPARRACPGSRRPPRPSRARDDAPARSQGGSFRFYEGEVADELVSVLRAMGSLIDHEDLAASRADYVEPISAPYRGSILLGVPAEWAGRRGPPDRAHPRRVRSSDPALTEADRIHLFAEATKAAYCRRDAIIGDPDFIPVDVEGLLCEASIARLRP